MIRNKFLKYFLAVVALVSVTTSCDNYLDVNKDPNNPTTVTPELILPAGQFYTAVYMHGARRLNHLANMIMYNWSESHGFSWYDQEFQYDVTSNFYTTVFDNAYTQPLKQYQLLAQDENPFNVNYKAIGMIMKAYHFQILVDVYGDVPYSDALLRGLNVSPTYESGPAIYADLLIKLTEAIDLIKTAPTTALDVENDAMFDGDMTAWIQFANSLKLRIANRWKDVNPGILTTTLDEIEEEGSGFITADVEVNPGFLNEVDKQNPFYASFGFGVTGTPSQNYRATPATDYIIDYLESTLDPRIDRLYEAQGAGHVGVPQGIEADADLHNPDVISLIGPGLLESSTQSSIIFTLAEQHFNMAEIALSLGDDATAQAEYESGVAASFATLGAGSATGYLNLAIENVGWDASPDKLEAIITQKWIAVNGITAEQSWFDYTRTGYPSGLPLSAEAKEPRRPVRLYYPTSEISFNGGNLPDQPDAFDGTPFWAE